MKTSENDRKCPFCGSPVQENASFCLHCMKELDNKTVIQKEKRRRRLLPVWICAAVVLVLCLNVAVAMIFCYFPNTVSSNKEKRTETVYDSAEADTEKKSSHSDSEKPDKITTDEDEDRATDTDNSYGKDSAETTSDTQPEKSTELPTDSQPQKSTTETDKTAGKTAKHTHSYISSVSKYPTCSVAGEEKYICSCGDSYVSPIAATGEHTWIPVTKTVHHDETGHYEEYNVSVPTEKYKCPICYKLYDSVAEYYEHFDGYHAATGDEYITLFRERFTTVTKYETETRENWIVDKKAYDETVTTGYKCSVCGTVK